MPNFSGISCPWNAFTFSCVVVLSSDPIDRRQGKAEPYEPVWYRTRYSNHSIRRFSVPFTACPTTPDDCPKGLNIGAFSMLSWTLRTISFISKPVSLAIPCISFITICVGSAWIAGSLEGIKAGHVGDGLKQQRWNAFEGKCWSEIRLSAANDNAMQIQEARICISQAPMHEIKFPALLKMCLCPSLCPCFSQAHGCPVWLQLDL